MTTDWHPYPYNFSNSSEIEGLGSFYQYLGVIESNWVGNVIILLIWIFVFGFSLMAGSRKAIAVASFVSLIFTVYFWMLGTAHPVLIIIFIIGVIVGVLGGKEEY